MKFRGALLMITVAVPLPIPAKEFEVEEMLVAHNRWRKEVAVPPVSYSGELARSAQKWADQLRNSGCRMKHSKLDGKYGENIYWSSPDAWPDGRRELHKATPTEVVDKWAMERLDYDYRTNRCAAGKMCGHYTQIVWKRTSKVGCGKAVCGDSLEQVWVCHYKPAGNWSGKKPY